jgi:hypothetical protein
MATEALGQVECRSELQSEGLHEEFLAKMAQGDIDDMTEGMVEFFVRKRHWIRLSRTQ